MRALTALQRSFSQADGNHGETVKTYDAASTWVHLNRLASIWCKRRTKIPARITADGENTLKYTCVNEKTERQVTIYAGRVIFR